MTGWPSGLAAAAVLMGAVLMSPPAQAAGDAVPHRTLFSFDDYTIFESSGLVDRGDVVYTNNDSGDDAVVYGVDPRTGRTVSRTTYAPSVHDVEAIAPGADGTVWAGDTGDNRHARDDIAVYHLGTRDGDHPGTRYLLGYPDGPHDAETLLVQPGTQRVFVVTKSVFGGVVYVAPRTLTPGATPQPLRAFARVDGLVTDGSFFPDGRRVVLRTYGTASVYTFPGFRLEGTVTLPSQRQGEGISVGADGRVLVSSEGAHSDVLAVTLPVSLTSQAATPATSGRVPEGTRVPEPEDTAGPGRSAGDWVGIAAVAVVLVGGFLLVRRSSRPG